MDSAATLRRLLISLAATLCLILAHSSTPAANSDVVIVEGNHRNRTAYDVLEFYNLPMGILPKGVIGYEINNTTGKFSAFLSDNNCTFYEGLHKLKYEKTVKGYLLNGKMGNVEGISMRFYLEWNKVVQILGMGNTIDFYVEGADKAGFPIDHFEDTRRCGCGVNECD